MDVADIPVMIIVGHVEGRRAAKGSDVATRGGGSATQRHGLSTCHPDSSRLGIEPKTPGWLVQAPTTSPSGDLIPTIRGSGAHPGRAKQGRKEHPVHSTVLPGNSNEQAVGEGSCAPPCVYECRVSPRPPIVAGAFFVPGCAC